MVVFALVTSLIPEYELLMVAKGTLSAVIVLYQLELTTVAWCSDEDGDFDESLTDVQEQQGF